MQKHLGFIIQLCQFLQGLLNYWKFKGAWLKQNCQKSAATVLRFGRCIFACFACEVLDAKRGDNGKHLLRKHNLETYWYANQKFWTRPLWHGWPTRLLSLLLSPRCLCRAACSCTAQIHIATKLPEPKSHSASIPKSDLSGEKVNVKKEDWQGHMVWTVKSGST